MVKIFQSLNPIVVKWVGKKATKLEFYVVVGSDVTMRIYLRAPLFKGEKCMTKIQPVMSFCGKSSPMSLKYSSTIKSFQNYY